MTPDFSKNHFELFGLPTSFALDAGALERAYRDVQREVHPDRYAAATDAEKRVAAQWATQANEAYRTLKSPLARGRYLLKLRGVDTQEETNTAMPHEFLIQQMAWREAVAEARAARDEDVLVALEAEQRASEKILFAQLEADLSPTGSANAAAVAVRKLRFLEKLGEEIDDALARLEA